MTLWVDSVLDSLMQNSDQISDFQLCAYILLVLKSGHSGIAWLIPRLSTPWLVGSPRNHHPWYWLCNTDSALSWRRKDFNFPRASSLRNHKDANIFPHIFPEQFSTIIINYSGNKVEALTLSQWALAGPVYTGMPLVDPVYTGITLGDDPVNTCKVHWNTTGKLSWNSPHWNATGETLTFATYTGTPLEGLWQPAQAPTHIVKHTE